MESSRIITYLTEHILADALYEDGKLMELSLNPAEETSLLGSIYVGKVKKIVKNIQAAFVEIQPSMLCYLPLEEAKNPIYVKPKKQPKLIEGDELLVQVSREAVKTKAPSVTSNISLNGKYLVLTTGNRMIGYSAKLKPSEKTSIKEVIDAWEIPEVGLIVRTNARSAKAEELQEEYQKLLSEYQFLVQQAIHRSVYSCVRKSRPSYLTSILGSRSEQLKEIVTDDAKLYQEILEFLTEEMPKDTEKLRLYKDQALPLKALYRMEKGMQDALAERVWLHSGAYLVIEPTEALTVIDVNTGKYTGGKDKQQTIQKINKEATYEIARQLRLRNLSGIILVDFVDMEDEKAKQELLQLMRELLKKDPQKAAAVDLTALGLMELTRKKQKKTLLEQAKECGI